MDDFWKLLSDKGLLQSLADGKHSLNDEQLRIILAELIFRMQALESQCLVLQSLLVEQGLTEHDELKALHQRASEFLQKKDLNKAKEGELIATAGITPLEWINFTYSGRFSQ